MSLSTYDPKKHVVIFAGVLLSGFADGQFVQVQPVGPGFTKKTGVDGDVTRSRSADRSGSLTVSLMQTSLSNDRLSAIYSADRAGFNGAGVGSLTIQDLAGFTLFFAARAWIANDPDATLDAAATTRDWQIDYAEMDPIHGGNPVN